MGFNDLNELLQIPPQRSGIGLDIIDRVVQLVRNARRHLTQRSQLLSLNQLVLRPLQIMQRIGQTAIGFGQVFGTFANPGLQFRILLLHNALVFQRSSQGLGIGLITRAFEHIDAVAQGKTQKEHLQYRSYGQ